MRYKHLSQTIPHSQANVNSSRQQDFRLKIYRKHFLKIATQVGLNTEYFYVCWLQEQVSFVEHVYV